MELLIVRHAQPDPVIAEGGVDPGLTELGRRQAAALGRWLAGRPDGGVDRIVSSPMLRAVETADAVARATGTAVEIESRLAEFDLGATEYFQTEKLDAQRLARLALALETGEWGDHRFDPAEFRDRVGAAFRCILDDTVSKRVMVVCHGGVMNSFLSGVLDRPHTMFFRPYYTSVSRVLIGRRGRSMIGSLNELPHAALVPDLTF